MFGKLIGEPMKIIPNPGNITLVILHLNLYFSAMQ